MTTNIQTLISIGRNTPWDDFKQPAMRTPAIEMQVRLCDLGLLDPVVDGSTTKPFGPVAKADGAIGLNTRNAFFEFCRMAGLKYHDTYVTSEQLRRLYSVNPMTFLPVMAQNAQSDSTATRFAKRVLRYMSRKGYWIGRSPNMYNIVYIEGVNADGRPNADRFNEWNDRRLVIRINQPSGMPELLVNDQATTEPGDYYTQFPLNPNGAARIAFGQYKAWKTGRHSGWQPALVQRGNVRLHRDKNKNGFRDSNDPIDIGDSFGINHHSTQPNFASATIGKYSAGCLVGMRYEWHLKFLEVVKRDVRYQRNNNYLFMTAVIPGDDLAKLEP